MKKLIIVFICLACLISLLPVYSQTDEPTEEISIEQKLDNVLASLANLQKTLKSQKRKRIVARKIRFITRKIIRAVNSVPPAKCLKTLKLAMNEFFDLVSELQGPITCAPPILPPFLPGESDLTINCIPPDDLIPLRSQTGGPFGGAFADVNPVYEDCRDVFQIDENTNEMPDVCEGEGN